MQQNSLVCPVFNFWNVVTSFCMHSINAFNSMNAQKHQVFMSCKKNYETFRNKVIFFTLRNYVCAQDTILDGKSPISGLFPPRFRLWARKIMLKQSGMHNLSKNQPKKIARSISGSQNSTMKNRVVRKTPFWMLNHQFFLAGFSTGCACHFA